MSKPHRGFTLVELMIVVVIVAILTAIALPSYRSYVQRAHRTAVKSVMANILSLQEQYFVDRKSYATSLTALGLAANTVYVDPEGNAEAAAATDSTYAVTLKNYSTATIAACSMSGAATALSYTVLATPYGGQVDDTDCAKLCQSNNGRKGASGTSSSCWSR